MGIELSISVIIPNFNGYELLRNNLPDLIQALDNFPESEIIIVDDASNDQSVNFVIHHYPFIKVISNPKNLGFARSVNHGIHLSKSDLVMILNNDIQLDRHYFEYLISYFGHEDTFGVMGTIMNRDSGKEEEGLKYPYFTFSEIRYKDVYIPASLQGNWIPTLYLCGGNALIDRRKLWQLGGFSFRYEPFYNEDLDLSLRAWMKGWKCYYEPKSICMHQSSSTIRKYFDESYIRRISRRNRLMLNYLYLNAHRKNRFLFKFYFKYFLYKLFYMLGIPSSYLAYKDFHLIKPDLKKELMGNNQEEVEHLNKNIIKIKKEIDHLLQKAQS